VAGHVAIGDPATIPLLDWSACANTRHRASISRAYYAVFVDLKCRLKPLVEAEGGCFPVARAHTLLIQAVGAGLRASGGTAWLTLPKRLQKLKTARERADYRWDVAYAEPEAALRCREAAALLSDVDAFTAPQVQAIAKELARISPNPKPGAPCK